MHIDPIVMTLQIVSIVMTIQITCTCTLTLAEKSKVFTLGDERNVDRHDYCVSAFLCTGGLANQGDGTIADTSRGHLQVMTKVLVLFTLC